MRRFAAFSNEYPWQWAPAEVEAFFDLLRSDEADHVIPSRLNASTTSRRPPPSLFDTGQALPPLDLKPPRPRRRGRDDLAGLLFTGQTRDNQLDSDLDSLRAQLHTLATDSAAIPTPQRGPLAGTQTFALATRYTLLLAAAARLGFWQAAQTRKNPFVGDPRWLAAVLARVRGHLGGHTAALPTGVTDWLLRELIRRERHGISFDLNETTALT